MASVGEGSAAITGGNWSGRVWIVDMVKSLSVIIIWCDAQVS